MIPSKQSIGPAGASSGIPDTAALGALIKVGPRKRKIVRLIELFARPLVALIDRISSGRSVSQSAEVRTILVIEYWNLGDMVMELPFFANLRLGYPKAHIILLASPKVVPIIEKQGLVDEIIELRVPWAQHYSRLQKYNPFSRLWFPLYQALRKLRMRSIDLAFSARADLRDNFMLWFMKVRRRVGYAFGGGGFFLTDRVVPDLDNPHFSNRWLRLLEHLGIPILERQPRMRMPIEHSYSAKTLLQHHGISDSDLVIGVHPGARNVNRQWQEDKFAEIVERLLDNFPVKILWFQEPGQLLQPPARHGVVSLSRPLGEFMAVLGECNLFLCNDSGPMHIATALNVPVVAVFGPTEPAWFGPLGANNQIVIRSGFWCRPCFDYCLFDQPYCLRTIGVPEVYEAVTKMLITLLASRRPPASTKKVPQAQNA